MRVGTSTCQTERVDYEPDPPTPQAKAPSELWVQMDRRRKNPQIGLPMVGLANDRTIAKIRRGELLTDNPKTASRGREVYERIDRLLRWHTGDAENCARTRVLPRPLEEVRENRRTRTLEVAAMLTRASAKISHSPDDVDQADLDEAERLARKILEERQGRRQDSGTGSTSGQPSS